MAPINNSRQYIHLPSTIYIPLIRGTELSLSPATSYISKGTDNLSHQIQQYHYINILPIHYQGIYNELQKSLNTRLLFPSCKSSHRVGCDKDAIARRGGH